MKIRVSFLSVFFVFGILFNSVFAQEKIIGSMSIMLLFPNKIYVARDRFGRTPVVSIN